VIDGYLKIKRNLEVGIEEIKIYFFKIVDFNLNSDLSSDVTSPSGLKYNNLFVSSSNPI
jgi:hypothetical protein